MMCETALKLLGIVLPSLVLVSGLRRGGAPLARRTALLLLALTLLALAPVAFTSALPVPLDHAAQGYPLRGVVGEVEVGNPLVNETANQILPWMQVARESLGAGKAPLWNRYASSGSPLLGYATAAPFSPFFLATLFVPLPQQTVAMGGLKIFVALVFCYLLLRREGTSEGAAVVGAVLYGLSLFQVVFLYFPLSSVTALLPALLYAVGSLARDPRPTNILFLCGVVACQLMSGHPESVLHCAMAAVAFLAIELAAPVGRCRWRAALPAMAVSVVLAAFLASPAWAPFVEQLPESARLSSPHAVAGTGSTLHLPLEGAVLLIDPDHFGHPARGSWAWGSNYAETATLYVGLVPLALLGVAVAGAGSGRRDRLLLAAGVGFLLLALDWSPVAHLVNGVWPLSWAANHRLRFVVCLFAALLTARALDRFSSRDVPVAALGSALVVLALLLTSHDAREPGSNACGLIALAGVWVALAVRFIAGLERASVAALAAPLIITELVAAVASFYPPVPRALYAPRLPIVEALRAHADQSRPWRVVGSGWTLVPDTATLYGLEDIRGSDPMTGRSYLDFLDLVSYRPPEGPSSRLVRSFPQPALDFLNVRYVLTGPGRVLREPLRLVYAGPDGRLYENERSLPRFFSPVTYRGGSIAEVVDAAPRVADFRDLAFLESAAGSEARRNAIATVEGIEDDGFGGFRLDVRADGGSLVVSSLPRAPGWRLRIDRRPAAIETVNGAFVGFFVPPGSSRVTLRYRPWTFDAGLAGAVLGLAGILAVTLAGRRRRRGHPAVSGERHTTS